MMETIGLIVVHSSLLVFTLLSCARTKNGKATGPPGVLGAPTKDEAPTTATPASSTVDPAPAPEALSTVAPTPSSEVSPVAPSVDRADAPSDVSTASPAVSTASMPTVATAASPSVATAVLPAVLKLEEHRENHVKYVGSEILEGNFFDGFGFNYSPSKRYAAIVMTWEGDNVILPISIMDVCSSSYNVYKHGKLEKERIEQLRNGTLYWLADDMIVIVQHKNDQLQRTIYELDHKKKTVSFVYTGEDTCKVGIQLHGDGNVCGLNLVNVLKRNCLMVRGHWSDFRYFQLFHSDPRVAPMFTHAFCIHLTRVRRHLQLTGGDDGVVLAPLCDGSKMRFLLTKGLDGLNEDGSTMRAPSQILTFDLEKVVQKHLRGNGDTVRIGAGDQDCWSVMTLDPVDPDIVVMNDSLFYPGPSSVIVFNENYSYTDKAGRIGHYEMIVIDYNTKKCHKMKFSGKCHNRRRKIRTYVHQYPLVRIEEWTWDEVRDGPCWTTLASFPPKAVPTLQDLCRDAVLKNREKYSQDLPDYAGILFPIVDV